MQDPKFSTVLGLLLEANKENLNKVAAKKKVSKNNADEHESDLLGRFSDSLKNVFREIF